MSPETNAHAQRRAAFAPVGESTLSFRLDPSPRSEAARHVLLVAQILVRSDEDIVAGDFGLTRCRRALVKQDTHSRDFE